MFTFVPSVEFAWISIFLTLARQKRTSPSVRQAIEDAVTNNSVLARGLWSHFTLWPAAIWKIRAGIGQRQCSVTAAGPSGLFNLCRSAALIHHSRCNRRKVTGTRTKALGQHQCRQPRTEDGNSDDHQAQADAGYQVFARGHWRPPCFEARTIVLLRFTMASRGRENGFIR
jgi:hypothetical protein